MEDFVAILGCWCRLQMAHMLLELNSISHDIKGSNLYCNEFTRDV